MSDVSDFIQCGDVYDVFNDNHIEAEFLFDHLTTQRIKPRQIFQDVRYTLWTFLKDGLILSIHIDSRILCSAAVRFQASLR